MADYKLTINLDATLAVQNENGSYNYFKPSVGAEVLIGRTSDMVLLNDKFRELYNDVIAPNFSAVVQEFILNVVNDEATEQIENQKTCNCNRENCDCAIEGHDCTGENCNCKSTNSEEKVEPEDDVEVVGNNPPKEDWE